MPYKIPCYTSFKFFTSKFFKQHLEFSWRHWYTSKLDVYNRNNQNSGAGGEKSTERTVLRNLTGPYLRIRYIFSDDIPQLCICIHQLHLHTFQELHMPGKNIRSAIYLWLTWYIPKTENHPRLILEHPYPCTQGKYTA